MDNKMRQYYFTPITDPDHQLSLASPTGCFAQGFQLVQQGGALRAEGRKQKASSTEDILAS